MSRITIILPVFNVILISKRYRSNTMMITTSTKNYRLTKIWHRYIQRYINKIIAYFPTINPNEIKVHFTIKRNQKRGPYEGSITLHLPIKNLYARFTGLNPGLSIHKGFQRIFSEIKKYRGKHFSGTSEYPDLKSIRQT